MKFKLVAILVACLACQVVNANGGQEGNGGDACEDRIKIIRDDIKSWIIAGGPAGLSLPSTISLARFDAGMLDQIARAQISCTDDKVFIGALEKTCKNFVDSKGTPQILCNITKIMKETSEPYQYVLIHHEYAGLAGFEVNDGPDSKYPISNQITEYLEDQMVKKLAVKPPCKQCSRDSEDVTFLERSDSVSSMSVEMIPYQYATDRNGNPVGRIQFHLDGRGHPGFSDPQHTDELVLPTGNRVTCDISIQNLTKLEEIKGVMDFSNFIASASGGFYRIQFLDVLLNGNASFDGANPPELDTEPELKCNEICVANGCGRLFVTLTIGDFRRYVEALGGTLNAP